MDYSSLLVLLLAFPCLAGIVMGILPSKHLPMPVFEVLHVISITVVLVVSLIEVFAVVFGGQTEITALGLWFRLDSLGAIFVTLIGVIGFLTGVYALSYIRHDAEIGHMPPARVKQFYLFFSFFLFTMLIVACSNNIILMWVGIEATTLSTVFLVGAYDAKLCLEAAWKYVIVCTAGVAFGMYGTLLIYANASQVLTDPHQAVLWTSALSAADQLNAGIVEVAFVFAVIGFGAKAGLFPMHTWLPDAHSEAPSPVSGLLSGVLLKCAILVIIRFYIIAVKAVGETFPHTVLITIGIVSVVMAAFAVLAQDDIKRKLAYSSCENIGLIALFLGFGGPLGIAAALLHCLTHGITKALVFCISGNILMRYGTRDLRKISGMMKIMPASAIIMAMGLFCLSGFPPFALFVSEISGITAGVLKGHWVILVVLVLALTVVVAAFAQVVTRAGFGKVPETMEKRDVPPLALAPEIVLVALALWFGVAMPAPIMHSVDKATAIVLQQDGPVLQNAPVFKGVYALFEGQPSELASSNKSGQ